MNNQQTPKVKHRKQTTWQIFLPLSLFITAMLALAVWAAVATAGNPVIGTEWAAVSIIFLSLPALLFGLILLLILVGFVLLLSKLIDILPYYGSVARTHTYQIGAVILNLSNQIVKPVLFVNGILAGWRTLLERLHLRKSRS
ncbi:MAG: hypothetical protein ROW52_09175 [Anaerolineaceae bacterium]|jgi:hypothetical protein